MRSPRPARDAGLFHEIAGLVRIGQQLLAGQLAFEAVPVFLVARSGLEIAEIAQFAFHRGSSRMGDAHHIGGDAHIVLVACTVLPSARSEPSIITEVKPLVIADTQVEG